MGMTFGAKLCNYGLLIAVPVIIILLGIGFVYFNLQIRKKNIDIRRKTKRGDNAHVKAIKEQEKIVLEETKDDLNE